LIAQQAHADFKGKVWKECQKFRNSLCCRVEPEITSTAENPRTYRTRQKVNLMWRYQNRRHLFIFPSAARGRARKFKLPFRLAGIYSGPRMSLYSFRASAVADLFVTL
jgi:hypothetical protein